ncbi:MAG: hypothetical protein Q4D54_02755 [Eubacteriales bacterium]|nr:hypothetical protein [Lachnospiraceae bacterium]MDO5126651.1 hypothetical protein [Eubacteriales bacterium]
MPPSISLFVFYHSEAGYIPVVYSFSDYLNDKYILIEEGYISIISSALSKTSLELFKKNPIKVYCFFVYCNIEVIELEAMTDCGWNTDEGSANYMID